MNKKNSFLLIFLLVSCNTVQVSDRTPVAQVGKVILYYDEIPAIIPEGTVKDDSAAIIQAYINKWAKRMLLLQKAEQNLAPELREIIESQMEETRENLVIYQYQRQMMIEKMDTVVEENELENYYNSNEKSFYLATDIVRALYIKLPVETPNLEKIKALARSADQRDMQQLETYCYQFAETYDDFNDNWIPIDNVMTEFSEEIGEGESFLRKYTFLEKSDSTSVYLLSIRDYRLRSSQAPYEYVKEDIRRIIWNNRRQDFIQSLENGIYNDALKGNSFKIF